MDPAIPVAPLCFSFTAEEKASFLAILREMRDELKKPLPPLQWPYGHSTPPAPQEAPKEKAVSEETRPQPLYQATVEDDNETMKHGNSILANKSTLSTIPGQCTKQLCRETASGPKFGFLTSFLTSLFGSLFVAASQFGCIRCMESMEASGEG